MGLVSSFLGAATAAPASARTAIEQPTQTVQKEHIDQCGMEYDSDEEDCELPPRIKDCQLTAEQAKQFQEMLDKIFSYDVVQGKRIRFTADEIVTVTEAVKDILWSEPMLIDDVPNGVGTTDSWNRLIPNDGNRLILGIVEESKRQPYNGVTIVADLHGQLHDLDRVFHADSKDGKPGWLCTKYVFLGDYVDRGRQSIEILMALFCIKALYPDRIFLLRGNHEFGGVNYRYGFPMECQDRYRGKLADFIYYKFNGIFCLLSVAAIVGDKFFCAHGGISTSGFTRRQLKRIIKPLINSTDDMVVHDIVWSDPAKGLRGASYNAERKSSIYYGVDVLAQALEGVQCIGLFRGHTQLNDGYEIVGNLMISLYSATGKHNDGAVALISEAGTWRIRVLEKDVLRARWDYTLKLIDARIEPADCGDMEYEEKEDVTVFGDVEQGQTGKIKAI